MRVTVTGGTGFLGSYICEELVRAGHEVSTASSADFDLRNPWETRGLIYETHAEAVVHAAAFVGGIGLNQAEPGRMVHDNLAMGVNLLEQSRLADVMKFVTIGTACMYPADAIMPLEEDQIWHGYPTPVTAPYAVAKRALLVMGQAYRAQYGMACEFVIPTNLYGPRDHFDPVNGHVMSAMIAKVSQAVHEQLESVTFWGTGNPTRDFLHVRDAARGVASLVDTNTDGSPINLGSGRETSIRELAELILSAYPYHGRVRWDETRPDGNSRRVMDITRAREVLGWEPQWSIYEGIRETVFSYEDQLR